MYIPVNSEKLNKTDMPLQPLHIGFTYVSQS